jgi:hypothetical protein
VRIPAPPPNSTADEIANHYARFRLQGAADDPHAPISGDVVLTRVNRQRYKIPIYNLTTAQPLPDVKGEGASDT